MYNLHVALFATNAHHQTPVEVATEISDSSAAALIMQTFIQKKQGSSSVELIKFNIELDSFTYHTAADRSSHSQSSRTVEIKSRYCLLMKLSDNVSKDSVHHFQGIGMVKVTVMLAQTQP